MRTENSNITFCEDFTIAYPSSCPPSRHGVGTKPGEIVPNVRVKERVLTSKMQQTVLDAERYEEERIPNDFNITFIEDFTNFLTLLVSPSLCWSNLSQASTAGLPGQSLLAHNYQQQPASGSLLTTPSLSTLPCRGRHTQMQPMS